MEQGRGSNVQKLARSALQLNVGLLAAVALAGILLGATYWGLSRLVYFEQQKVNLHFARLVGNVHEYERFLLEFIHATEPASQWYSRTAPPRLHVDLARLRVLPRGEVDIYEGQQFSFSPLFSLTLPGQRLGPLADDARERQLGLGIIASSFYTSYWSRARYPAPQMVLLDLDSTAGVAVPSIDARTDVGTQGREGFLRVLQNMRERIRANPPSPGVLKVQWLSGAGLSGGAQPELLAFISDNVPDELWWSGGAARRMVAAAVLDLGNTDRLVYKPAHGSVDLVGPDGQVLSGTGTWVKQYDEGVHLTPRGVLIRRGEAGGGGWQAAYLVDYGQVFRDGRGTILTWLLWLGGMLGAGWVLMRWYRRRVVAPASETHRALQESHAFNRAIIQTAPVALCVLGKGGREVVTQNALAQAWLGGPEAILALMRDWHLFDGGQPVAGEACVVAGPLSLHARYAPAQYQGENVLLCAFNDITSHREAESALRETRAAADAASAAKSRFLATMSHEIRTPLYGVVSTLELLGLTPLDARQQGYLQTIRSSSDILLQLISDILDVSKIEAGQMPLDSEPFSPLDVSEEILRSYAARAHEKGLQLYGCIDADVPASLVGDGMRIRQVLGNLVNNAIKFTDTGHVVLRLSAVRQAARPERVALRWEVADTGAGMTREQQERLFEPFYQVEEGRPPVGGTGLGLSICSRLCQMMDGSLDVASVPGLGSQFTFGVTLGLPPQEMVAAQVAAPLQGRTVHVRAPIPELADSVCRWLEALGAEAVAMTGPAEGEALRAAQGRPDSVLLELLPAWLPPVDWTGGRVQARYDAPLEPQPGAGGWQVNLHNREGIALALAAAAGGPLPAGGGEALTPAPTWQALGLRVLVAEDNPVNRMLLQAQLEELGCTVTVAANGEEALRRWQADACDVVLTDVNMPVMDGYAFARALRARDAALPIIGVTANAMRDEGERCLAAGMNAWLTKPMSLQTLYARLRQAAGQRGVPGREAAADQEHAEGARRGAKAAAGVDEAAAGQLPAADALAVPAGMHALFLSTMREDLEAIRAAIGRDDAAQVRQLLHRMRGALAVARGEAMVVACRELERALPDGVPLAADAPLQALVARIAAAVARV